MLADDIDVAARVAILSVRRRNAVIDRVRQVVGGFRAVDANDVLAAFEQIRVGRHRVLPLARPQIPLRGKHDADKLRALRAKHGKAMQIEIVDGMTGKCVGEIKSNGRRRARGCA